ncbi:TolC family protein, partial [Bacteroidales bacterium OttesenSCG-928-K22]|nr:TolC family protein [Bacteroidales bacterium OttesenSCG-928-K22]
KGETLHLQVPNELLLDAIEQSKVEFEAKQNGSAELYYQQNLLEAQSELAQSKSDHGFAVNLYASFGLSQSDELFRNAYINPLNQEQITLSFTIPVIDWGVAKQKRKRAEVVFHNTTLSIKQDELDFYRNLNNIVRQFNLHNSYLKLVKKTGELSSIRFEMSKERYIVGKIGFLDYSVAQNERNNAQLNYIKTLKKSWVKYYEIRKLTLYDFIEDKKIDVELRK